MKKILAIVLLLFAMGWLAGCPPFRHDRGPGYRQQTHDDNRRHDDHRRDHRRDHR